MPPSRLIAASSPLRQLARQSRFVRERLRIVVPSNQYYVQAESARALRELGHDVVEVPIGERGDTVDVGQVLQRLLRACAEVRPDMLFSVNYTGFDRALWLNEAIDAMALPTAVWFVDSPFLLAMGYLPPVENLTQFFVWDRSYVPVLQRLGARQSFHLPLATCPSVFRHAPQPTPAARLPLSFVGHSLKILVALWKTRVAPESMATAELWANQLACSKVGLHDFVRAPKLPVDPDVLTLGLANCLASAEKRAALLRRLDSKKLFVFGDDGFQSTLRRSNHPGTCVYGPETARIYQHSDITLNVTNTQMPTAVNQRIFDVPACGGFLLTDRQPELCEHFDLDTQMATFASGDELCDKAEYFARRPALRAQMAASAQKRALDEHTYVHRMRDMVARMREQFGRVARPPAKARTACEPPQPRN